MSDIYSNPMFGIQERMANWDGPGPGPQGTTGGALPTDVPVDEVIEPTIFEQNKEWWEFQQGQNAIDFQKGVETATSILQSTLKYYGMEDPALLAEIKTALGDRRLTGSSTMDDIGIQLRESAAFKQRFAGNEALRAAGKPMYSVSQYLQLEASYKQQLIAAGMPKGFYDTNADFANFIANETSPDELGYRLQQGYAAVKNADPAVVNELKSLYGLQDGTIAAFFLDPAKTRDEVIRAANASMVANQARKQAGYGLTASDAELLVKQGITEQGAQQGFSQIAQQQDLFRSNIQGEQSISQQDIIAGTFGTEQGAARRIAERKRGRTAGFEAGGGYATTTSGTNVGLSTVGQ
jgi:hypothetical protein